MIPCPYSWSIVDLCAVLVISLPLADFSCKKNCIKITLFHPFMSCKIHILIRTFCYIVNIFIHLKFHFSLQIPSKFSKNTPEFGQSVSSFCVSHVMLTLNITDPDTGSVIKQNYCKVLSWTVGMNT